MAMQQPPRSAPRTGARGHPPRRGAGVSTPLVDTRPAGAPGCRRRSWTPASQARGASRQRVADHRRPGATPRPRATSAATTATAARDITSPITGGSEQHRRRRATGRSNTPATARRRATPPVARATPAAGSPELQHRPPGCRRRSWTPAPPRCRGVDAARGHPPRRRRVSSALRAPLLFTVITPPVLLPVCRCRSRVHGRRRHPSRAAPRVYGSSCTRRPRPLR